MGENNFNKQTIIKNNINQEINNIYIGDEIIILE